MKYNASQGSVCADQVDRVYGAACSRAATATVTRGISDACDQVLVGTVPAGGACFFSEECADQGSCTTTDPNCSRSLQCCAGTCMAKTPTVPVGGNCASGDICASGSYCDTSVSGVSGTCVVPSAPEGAACTNTSTTCAAPLYCDTDPSTGMGTCRRPAPSGAACNVNLIYTSCDEGRDYCDPASGTCIRRPGIGAACSSAVACVGYATCVGTTCAARPKPGQACDATNGPTCLGSLPCDATSSTCTAPPVGAACM